MKKTFALLLCIVLCFYFIPLPLSAAGMIQYKAIIETEPGPYVLENATSVSDAVYNSECIGVVVYCLYTEVDPPQVSDAFDSFEDKTVILSDVTFTGYIGCRELYLLGNAKMIVENENMEISGILLTAAIYRHWKMKILSTTTVLISCKGPRKSIRLPEMLI